MRVTSLTLKDFRNYTLQKIDFSKTTNIFCGNNANGKTNILEAIYLFGYGKSHRAKSDSEMIRFGSEASTITLDFVSKGREFSACIKMTAEGKKKITVNNVPVKSLSRLLTYFHAVLFCPDDLLLIKGSPSGRRKFIDASICRIYPSYFSALSEYKKASSEKNALLKELKKSGKKSDAYLSVWNEQLSEAAEKIMSFRRDFVLELSEFAAKIQGDISKEDLKLSYLPDIKATTKEEIFEILEQNQRREIECASMQKGIQRDDISIYIGDTEAKSFASQGQQRTAALALRIAEADYVFAKTGEYPVLLLDDILSELDIGRRMYLWERIVDKQVLITCTDTDFFENKNESRIFNVADNTVTKL